MITVSGKDGPKTKPKMMNQLIVSELQKYNEIINSPPLQRLKKISFLGAIDFNLKKKQTRYVHTLGVASLAVLYSHYAQLASVEKKHLIIAALLHDIGHPPFSHSSEKFFTKEYELDHHLGAIQILKGKSPLGSEVSILLRKRKIDIDWIIAIIKGEDRETQAGKAFSNPINIDTIDAIIRAARYYKKTELYPKKVLISLFNKNTKTLDKFWKLKNEVYNNFIFKDKNLIKDIVNWLFIKTLIKLGNTSRNELFFNDESDYVELFLKFKKDFFSRIYSQILDPTDLTICSRNYYIDTRIEPKTFEEFYKRYKVIKNSQFINVKNILRLTQYEYSKIIRPI